jgi:hypothetical protein
MSYQDVYYPDVNTTESAECGVCHEKMLVERNCYGSRGIYQQPSHYDFFYCKFRKELWHKQGKVLLELAKQSPSSTIEQILKADAESIISNRTPTKSTWAGMYFS